jgi:hypothetical protein
MSASGRKIVIFYILMLTAHIGHVTEEILGRFFLIEKVGGLPQFLIINIFLFFIVLFMFVSVLKERLWAYRLSIIYAVIMIINGFGHNIATIISGKYYGGFAGGFSGIALVLIGPPLIYFIWKGMPETHER